MTWSKANQSKCWDAELPIYGPFSVSVEAISLGSATLNWQPQTQNEDGTALVDLAGYHIYWGAGQLFEFGDDQ